MIKLDDFEALISPQTIEYIEQNLDRDPLAVALDKKIPHPSLVSTQVKYLHRAKTKLPSYFSARCVIPPLAFEQSSSEQTAQHKEYSGKLCLDLTCGLGVDSFYLAKSFAKVISIEKDPLLARITSYNMRLLGAENVEVINTSAEEFLAANPDLRADLIYIDPDRRNSDGKKMVALDNCSPDIGKLIGKMSTISRKLVVKLSPMFDVDEAFRFFGESTKVEVVSLNGECKEVLVETGSHITAPLLTATALGVGSVSFEQGDNTPRSTPYASSPGNFKYLIVPDVALQKARLAVRYYQGRSIYIDSDNSFAFANSLDGSEFGKIYRIVFCKLYSPKALKKQLRNSGIKRMNIMRRNFPFDVPAIVRELGISEGGETFGAFTCMGDKRWMLILERVS